MKAQELMIGDWVRTPIDFENGAYVYDIDRISSINEYDAFSTSEFDMCGDVADLLPVPLTAEILEKNFAKRLFFDGEFEGYSYVTDGMQIDQLADSVFVWICPGTINGILSLRYVHELQHALRLCGIEKEIQL